MTLSPKARRRLRWTGAIALLTLAFGVAHLVIYRTFGGGWIAAPRNYNLRTYLLNGDPTEIGVPSESPAATRFAKTRADILRRLGPGPGTLVVSGVTARAWNTFPVWPGGVYFEGSPYIWKGNGTTERGLRAEVRWTKDDGKWRLRSLVLRPDIQSEP